MTVDSVTATENASRKSTILSWLAVLALGLVIFGIIRGLLTEIAWFGDRVDWLESYLFGWLTGRWDYYYPVWIGNAWAPEPVLTTVLILLIIVLLAAIVSRRRSANPRRAERRAQIWGSWVLYFPSFAGSLPAAVGVVSEMATPFLGGGLISVMAVMLQRIGLTHGAGDWIARGVVSPSRDYANWWEGPRFVIAQSIVAIGLAITIIGFIQVFQAYKEKRLQTQGLYATVRHPQHLGIALWTFGLAFAVSGTAGYMAWFTVLYFYVLLAHREEGALAQQFGSTYEGYRRATPFMIPFVNIGLPLPKTNVARVAALIAYYVGGIASLCLIMQAIGVQHPYFL